MNADPDAVVKALAASMGLNAADLVRIAAALGGDPLPTVEEFLPVALERCSEKSLPTYKLHFRRLANEIGTLRLDEVTVDDIERLRDKVRAETADRKIERASETHRPLRSSEHDAHGHGAAENFVRASRYFFQLAVKRRLIHHNPARDVPIPKRKPAPERPLTAEELRDFAFVACSTGNDPELDGLLFEFHRKTAARREGGLNLRLQDLDPRRGAVTLTEKFGKTREQPLDVDLLERLRAFAVARGAVFPTDKVFRSRKGTPITRRRYGILYDRLDAHTEWSEVLDIGIHWLRHTTLDDVRVVADERVAQAYAGHADDSGATILLYTKVRFEELAAVFEVIFGPRFTDEHPTTSKQ